MAKPKNHTPLQAEASAVPAAQPAPGLADYPPDTKCRTDGLSYEWHQKHQPKHVFRPEEEPTPSQQDALAAQANGFDRSTAAIAALPPATPTTPVPIRTLPADPVLRMALIQKGLITPEDLSKAEETIFATQAHPSTAPASPPPTTAPTPAEDNPFRSNRERRDARADRQVRKSTSTAGSMRSSRAKKRKQPG